MGMRRNIELNYGPKGALGGKIYFYTHWGAEGLEDCLRAALIRGHGGTVRRPAYACTPRGSAAPGKLMRNLLY